MRALAFPAVISEPYPGDFVITFPDIPEAISGGSTPDDALFNGADALSVAIEHYLDRDKPVPLPRAAAEGQHLVVLEPIVAARLLLASEMTRQGLNKSALAARMNKDEKVVRRILSGKGASLELTLSALKAVGLRPALAA